MGKFKKRLKSYLKIEYNKIANKIRNDLNNKNSDILITIYKYGGEFELMKNLNDYFDLNIKEFKDISKKDYGLKSNCCIIDEFKLDK